jgi:quercetin dioxygenase-like cupin family protein
MLSLVERGRAAPSLGSLMVVANALNVPLSNLIVDNLQNEDKLVIRRQDQPVIRSASNVLRRLLREDLERGISISLNEYAPNRGGKSKSLSHDGFEYVFVLKGELTIEVSGVAHIMQEGDLISYKSRKPHRIWNSGNTNAFTLWINLHRD